MKNFKYTHILFSILLLSIVLIGCGQAEDEVGEDLTEQDHHGETFIFTDSTGRDVELPKEITKIAPSGPLAQMVLHTVATDKFVGLASSTPDFVHKYYDEDYLELPVYGSFFKDTFNLEELIKADPDVIIDIGEGKKGIDEDMDEIQETTNIPTIFIEADLESIPEAYTTLGELLNEQEQAKALADYSREALQETKEITATIPEEERVSLFFGMYESGLHTNAAGSFHSEVIDYVAAENVAVLDDSAGKGSGNEVSMEQLLLWEPDMILFSADSVYDEVTSGDERWKDLDAVKKDQVYEIPEEPYNWLSFPPSVNRILGIKWLGNLVYPEQFDIDMVEETKRFYELFYHYDLSDEEAASLLERSTLKVQK